MAIRIEKAYIRKQDRLPAFKKKKFVYDVMDGRTLITRQYSEKEAKFWARETRKRKNWRTLSDHV